MQPQAEFGFDGARQARGPDGAAATAVVGGEAPDLGRDLARPAGAEPTGHEASQTALGEGGAHAVEGHARDTEAAGSLGLGDAVALDAAQHFVAHLQQVTRIEEVGIVEDRSEDPFGMRVEQARATEGPGFGTGVFHGVLVASESNNIISAYKYQVKGGMIWIGRSVNP